MIWLNPHKYLSLDSLPVLIFTHAHTHSLSLFLSLSLSAHTQSFYISPATFKGFEFFTISAPCPFVHSNSLPLHLFHSTQNISFKEHLPLITLPAPTTNSIVFLSNTTPFVSLSNVRKYKHTKHWSHWMGGSCMVVGS